MNRLISHLLCFIFLLVQPLKADELNIVTTTGMITDIVQNVIGELGQVHGLMGPGIDPHLYKPTRSDIARLSQADLVFYNGLLLEGRMTDALLRVASSGRKVVAVTESLEKNYLLEPEEFNGHYDPHVWMDPLAWKQAVLVVQNTMLDLYPNLKSILEKNTNEYLVQIDQLHAYAEQVLGKIKPSSRILVSAHDAFNYFGRRYGFEVVGIQGLSTESEAGVKDIENVVDLLVKRKIAAIFVESTVSDRNIKALIQGAQARGHMVHIGGQLFSDAMGAAGSYEGTYIGMIDHNITTIANALGSSAPASGLHGLLGK